MGDFQNHLTAIDDKMIGANNLLRLMRARRLVVLKMEDAFL